MRERRKTILLKQGFLPFEAQELSIVKKIPPYFKRIVLERRSLLMNAKKYHWSKEEYLRRVRSFYVREKIHPRGLLQKRLSVWDLLRKYEDKYKDKFPAYETPTGKKHSKLRDFNYTALARQRRIEERRGGKPYG